MIKFTLALITFLTFTAFIKSQGTLDFNLLYHSAPACKMGRLQSPLNLIDTGSVFNSTINLLYESYEVVTGAQLAFSPRTMLITHSNTEDNLGYITLARNGVLKKYALQDIEFAYLGEHQIDSIPSDLEVRFIHQEVEFFETTVNQYRKLADANNFLIISVLYKLDGKASDNGFISDLMKTTVGTGNSINLDISSYGLFKDRQFYFYEGSFTYSPCNENVNHIVIRDMFSILKDHLDYIAGQYKLRFSKNGDTSKDVSDWYGRAVYRNYEILSDVSAGYFKLSFIILLLTLLF
jgi:carbonic anhydrase